MTHGNRPFFLKGVSLYVEMTEGVKQTELFLNVQMIVHSVVFKFQRKYLNKISTRNKLDSIH